MERSYTEENYDPKPVSPKKSGFKWSTRHTMIIIAFIGTSISSSIQNDLSLAIVPMTQSNLKTSSFEYKVSTNDGDGPVSNLVCPKIDSENSSIHKHIMNLKVVKRKESSDHFNWTEKEQGLILGSFYWGYVFSQYPGGRLAHKHGGKWVFAVGVTLSGVLSLLLPFVTRQWGYVGLIVIRVFQGLAQGVTCPAIQVMLAHWSPPHERSRMTNLVYTGYIFGSAVTYIGGGYLMQYFDWTFLFYVVGTLTIIWFILWAVLVYNTPSEHPYISTSELHLIKESMKENSIQKNVPTPWKEILLSLPFWAIMVLQIGHFWGKNIIHIEIPKYLGAVHGLQIQQIGWIAALPLFLNCVFGMFTSSISDLLIIKQVTSVEFTRKFCAAIVGCGTSAAFIGMCLGGCNTLIVLCCLFAGGMFSGASRGSWMVNTIDISPNHSGTIIALGNIASYCFGMGTPYVTGIILYLWPTVIGWQIVFVIGAIANFSVSLFYIKFAKATEQSWNTPKTESNNNGL